MILTPILSDGILDAIRKRDSESAKTLMEEHLGRTRKTVTSLYNMS